MILSQSAGEVASTRRVVLRTRGNQHGPVTRLMSPSDLGELIRPFIFLDLIDRRRTSPAGFGLHPHSGIATLTWIMEGSVGYEDTLGRTGQISERGVEWMHAGAGAWHGGDFGKSERLRGFQLWIALPPDAELGQAESIYLEPDVIESDGPVTVLLGSYGSARSAIQAPSPINYLSVKLKAGEHWRYQPPQRQTVGWMAVSVGKLFTPEAVHAGELAIFDESDGFIDFHAETDTEFVLASAVKHPHDLVLGYYSVHTSAAALRAGEARIREIGAKLREQGRLR
ncbi:pirin family protein [Cupriavidus sp. CP313]